jgi:hypothetical protein
VPGHDDRDAGGYRIKIEMRDLVDDVDADVSDLDVHGEREFRGPDTLVVVSTNGDRESDVTQAIQHV